MLWIALHLPSLSLETFSATLAGDKADGPVALLSAHKIVGANAAARALGVQPGLKRATALSLAPHLTLGEADPARDAEALATVAHAALAFTPSVSIAPTSPAADAPPPHTVLLEVEPSLRYFGGHAALHRKLLDAVAPLGHRLHTVSAPTPLGAALLARVHPALQCADLAHARAALDAAPVWLLGPGRAHWDALQGMGLRTIADLRRLPRSGLARRFGEAVLDEVDRAFGHVPDPRVPLSLPPVFESRLELFARADTTQQVIHGAGLLLPRLVAWLSAQHAAARRYTLVMAHEPRWRASQTPAATPLEVALAEPSRDAAHLLGLLQERLAQIELAAPTLELRLHCDDFVRLSPPNTELFPTARGEREGLTRLIERLQARLGPAQVQRLCEVEDHRPEYATAVIQADAVRGAGPSCDRASRSSRRGGQAAVDSKGSRSSGVASKGMRSSGVALISAVAPVPAASQALAVSAASAVWAVPAAPAASSASAVAAVPAASTPSALAILRTPALPVLSASKASPFPTRPVWLMPDAEPLQEKGAGPLYEGRPLHLLSGPERIESGWWDGDLAERDYYIAQDAGGALLWIYRSRLLFSPGPIGWFLQGRFG